MGGECNIKCGIFKKGFESNDHGYKETGNRRNGYTHKTLKTTMGDVEINAPRDRDGSFDANSGQTVRPFRNKRCSYSDVTVHLF